MVITWRYSRSQRRVCIEMFHKYIFSFIYLVCQKGHAEKLSCFPFFCKDRFWIMESQHDAYQNASLRKELSITSTLSDLNLYAITIQHLIQENLSLIYSLIFLFSPLFFSIAKSNVKKCRWSAKETCYFMMKPLTSYIFVYIHIKNKQATTRFIQLFRCIWENVCSPHFFFSIHL